MKPYGKNTVTFAIIGCGEVTEVKSGPALQKIAGSRLKTVMRRDGDKARDYALRHGVAHYTADYLEILRDPEIDAVYIATPPDMHCFYTLEAAKYGKAVYVEKPMARTVAECRQMTAACGAAGVPLFTAYYRRGQEKFQTILSLLSGGAIGAVRSFSYRFSCPAPVISPQRVWLMDPARAGGGLLYDIGSHMLDMLRFLLGEADSACSISQNRSGLYAVNDTHSAALRFASGVQGTVQLTFCADSREDEAVFLGESGSLRFSIMDNEPVCVTAGGRTRRLAFAPMEHVQQGLLTRVVDTLLGRDTLEAGGAYGLGTQELLEAVEQGRAWRRNEAAR